MNLSELLKERLIITKAVCDSKDVLIQKLVERIYSEGCGPSFPSGDVLNTIYMREKIGGTLLPSGLSVPHARLMDFDGFVLALGTPAGALFHGGQQIRLMALMITSQSGGPYYLRTLAALTKISRDSGCFSRLCAAEEAGDFTRILKEHDQDLG